MIDADYGYTGGAEVSGVIRLKAGLHPFRLYYRRGNADSPSLTFKWSNPAGLKSEVPASALFR